MCAFSVFQVLVAITLTSKSEAILPSDCYSLPSGSGLLFMDQE